MKDENSGSMKISLPGNLAHEFFIGRVLDSPKSAPSLLEMPQHGIVSSTSSISREDHDVSLRPIIDEGSTKASSRYPHCVSTSLDNATLRNHSPVSTLTPEQLSIHQKRLQDTSQAIDLSLRFLSGIPPAKSEGHGSALMPGVCYQSFDDFLNLSVLTSDISKTAKAGKKNRETCLAMRPGTLVMGKRLLTTRAKSVSNLCQSEEESTLQDINDIDVSFLTATSFQEGCMSVDPDLQISETLANGMPANEIEVAPSSSFLAAETEGGVEGEKEGDPNGDGDDDGGVYEPFDQGEELTLCEFEDKVTSALVTESHRPGTDLYDPTGFLTAMDRILDCFDPQLTPEERLDYSPRTYDSRSLDSHDGDLDFEAAMERDGMNWLLPCCDDSEFDKELHNFLEEGTVGDVPHRGRLYVQPPGSVDSDSLSTIERNREPSVDFHHSKGFAADHTMTTDSDSSLELSD